MLGTAYGIAISLIAHHLDARGFTKPEMGSLASWFALGIVSLSLPMGRAIRRLSAKTTLVACLAGYAGTVSLFPFLGSYFSIAVDRFFDGAFSVGIWVSCETILLSRADRDMKAYVTSLYAVSIALGYVIGPLAAEGIVHIATIQEAFFVSGVLAAAATGFVALRLDRDVPERVGTGPMSDGVAGPETAPGTLLARIKTSCFATFAYGYFQ